jgi:hypothetical protein
LTLGAASCSIPRAVEERDREEEEAGADAGLRAARAVTVLFTVGVAGLVAFILWARFSFPYELEWMTGSILDHVERLREGKPLYGPPSGEFTPFIYPPGYYWVAAQLSRVVPEVAAARSVSLASSAVAAVLAYPMARRAGASRFFAVLGPLLYVACFSFVCSWYDLERADALFSAMLALSATVLLCGAGVPSAAAAGAVLGLSFFVKQPASTFVLAVPIGLVVVRQRARALAFASSALAVLGTGYALLQRATDGWFAFYCLKVPAAHGMAMKYFTLFVVTDVSKAGVLSLATFALGAELARAAWARARRQPVAMSSPRALLATYLLAGFVASGTSRMHVGGWSNVLVFWTTFAVPAVAVAATRFVASARPRRAAELAVLGAIALQVGAFAPDPFEAVPGERDRAYPARIAARVRELEASGDVILLGRGHVTRNRHLHVNALVDVQRAGYATPQDLIDGFEGRRYAALILNEPEDVRLEEFLGKPSPLFEPVARNYFVAERLDDRQPMPVVGFPTVPRWVFRPRKVPLSTRDEAALLRRLRLEMGLAERNMRVAQARDSLGLDGLEIEDEAAALDR